MPCDTVTKSRVEFLETSTDASLLAKGLKKLNYTVSKTRDGLMFYKAGITGAYESKTGRLQLNGRYLDENDAELTNEIKRSYSEEVVIDTAEQMGWEMEWRTNENGNREVSVQRRSY